MNTAEKAVYYCDDEDDGHAKKNKWVKTWLPSDTNEEEDDKSGSIRTVSSSELDTTHQPRQLPMLGNINLTRVLLLKMLIMR